MKVLAIGNSFSQDAMRYLHRLAKADGVDLKTVNLYIGGCPLSKHYENMNNDAAQYEFEFNGENTGIRVSIRQALQSDIWDVVTMQQVSSLSNDYDTYQPYLEALDRYVSLHAPKAQHMIHQTWAYEQGSERLCREKGYKDQADMFADIKDAYNKAAKSIGKAKIIPSGEVMQELIRAGVPQVHRDTFHAHLGIGRYAIALTWYETLTGNSAVGNRFRDFDAAMTANEIKTAQECAHAAVMKYK